MNIFITGVAGFLGSNLADYYVEKGHKVIGCDNLVGGDKQNVNKQVEFHKGDCENLELMTKIMNGVDVVCHAAAFAHEGLSNISPTLICRSNVSGSISIFTAAIRNKVKRILFCSSMARYGNIKMPFKEDDIPNPVDPYGVFKLSTEKVLKILCETHKLEFNIAVPHNIIGPKQKYDDPFRNVASIMTNLMLQGRRPIIYGDGNQKRCFSDIKDCIYCLDKLLLDPNIKSQIVNIGPDEELVTINELFEKISNKIKFNQNPIYEIDRPNEVKVASCSSDKARKLLGYKTKVDLDTSLDNLINYIKSNGTKNFNYVHKLEIDNEVTPNTWKKRLF